MSSSLLIQNAVVLSPASGESAAIEKQLDLRIEGETIAEVGEHLKPQPQDTIFDARGLAVAPGFVDLHTHLRDLGQADREDIGSGTMAAAAGGYTTVVAMANTDPPVDNSFVLSRVLQLIAERALIEVLPIASVTKNIAGEELTNMVQLADMGAIAFSDDGMPITNLAVLLRALSYVKLAKTFIISHAEDRDLSGGGCMNECSNASRLGLPAIVPASESACVAREIEIARQTGGRLHFAHISTRAAVALIAMGKSQGLQITADVTPHHLCLTDEDVKEYDTSYKMNPPLRSRADQEALVSALLDGTIDAIATDHAPHAKSEKAKTFDKAPFGVIGLETAFPLTYERLVLNGACVDSGAAASARGRFTRLKLIELLSTRPAAILGRTDAVVAQGARANLAILDFEHKWTYDASNGHSKSQNSPFHQRQMVGKNLCTIFNGRIVYQDRPHTESRLNSSQVAAK